MNAIVNPDKAAASSRIITIKFGIEKRYGNPDGTKSEFSLNFLSWVLNWNKDQKKKIIKMLELAKDRKVIKVSNPRKLDLEIILQ